MKPRVALAVVVVTAAALIAATAWLKWYHRPRIEVSHATASAYGEVAVGESKDAVMARLGDPSGQISQRVIMRMFPESVCSRGAAKALYYYRESNQTFIIFFDEHEKVLCKEARNIAIHVD